MAIFPAMGFQTQGSGVARKIERAINPGCLVVDAGIVHLMK